MTGFAARERSALADLMLELGPDAPTLCEGWTTRDLAAHLVVRSNRIDAAPGILIPALAGYTAQVQRQVAEQDWAKLVAKVRRLPWWVLPADEVINRAEYFIHHEDVRRAQDGWQPRKLSAESNAALWQRVKVQARLVLRRTPAAVTVTAPGCGSATAGRGGPPVDLVGPPSELLMFLSGRQQHAQVELAGSPAITQRMWRAHYGV
ncbi:MAG TPA: TIGR03085 family metal-binding protein [Micromonosporaceae bacterium]